MALQGIGVARIQLWGRWRSDVVRRYVQETPLEGFDVANMMCGWRGKTETGVVLKPSAVKRGTAVQIRVSDTSTVEGTVTKVAHKNKTWTVTVPAVVGDAPDVVVQCGRHDTLLL